MFRLAEAEFLTVFEECAVYVNKYGDVSCGLVMEFVGRATSACLWSRYLVVFNDEFAGIRDAMDGRLKQAIAGNDVEMLDDAGEGSGEPHSDGPPHFRRVDWLRTIKFCMQHPEQPRIILWVELLPIEEKSV